MVRNPLVCLLSAFRNNLEPPLDTTNTKHFLGHLKAAILNLFRPATLRKGMADKSVKLQVLFEEFVDYMTVFPLHDYNEHFQPVMDLCAPCAIPYDFYLNFDSYLLQCRHAPPQIFLFDTCTLCADLLFYKMEIIVRHSDKYNSCMHGTTVALRMLSLEISEIWKSRTLYLECWTPRSR